MSTRSEYLLRYSDKSLDPASRQAAALETAHDIRKFEIDLYWKRASYFWTFIAATLAAFFVLQQKPAKDNFDSTYVVACLGFVFSLAWYFVNRGSKSWQRNWEMQVDLLEDELTGPLYKTGINRYENRFWDITAGYHFSPTKINHLLGFYMAVVWFGLIVRTLIVSPWWCGITHLFTAVFMSALTVIACLLLWYRGQTAKSDRPVKIDYRTREYEDTESTPEADPMNWGLLVLPEKPDVVAPNSPANNPRQ